MPKITKKTVKKAVKKVSKKVEKAVKKVAAKVASAVEEPLYNEYGTCIACQGGDPNCLHTNLSDTNGKIICVTCGKCLSE